jgi:hypothetical protein
MSQDVIRRIDVGNGIATEYCSPGGERLMRATALINGDRALTLVDSSIAEGRLAAARLWLKYAALRLATLEGQAQKTRCRTWLDLVVKLAQASLAAAQP